jgi:hypothetical protein
MCCNAGGKTYRGPSIQDDTISPYMPVVVSFCAALGVPKCVQLPMGDEFKGPETATESACNNNQHLLSQTSASGGRRGEEAGAAKVEKEFGRVKSDCECR